MLMSTYFILLGTLKPQKCVDQYPHGCRLFITFQFNWNWVMKATKQPDKFTGFSPCTNWTRRFPKSVSEGAIAITFLPAPPGRKIRCLTCNSDWKVSSKSSDAFTRNFKLFLIMRLLSIHHKVQDYAKILGEFITQVFRLWNCADRP